MYAIHFSISSLILLLGQLRVVLLYENTLEALLRCFFSFPESFFFFYLLKPTKTVGRKQFVQKNFAALSSHFAKKR